MSTQHFRSALNGFRREDVVRYIEFLNNQHNSKVEQLNSQLQVATARASAADPALKEQLDSALEKIAQLEAQLAEKASASDAFGTPQELEAYRRAERAERLAQERAQQICTQTNAVLADATAKAEAAAEHIAGLAQQANAQLDAYREAISNSQEAFRDAVSALYALQPQTEE
ncbi:MAG: hypothetical protein IJB47_03475 [Oscillospiraceae bacterium]|nr:hypothetical protein [Oscillospiraceae bacterium]